MIASHTTFPNPRFFETRPVYRVNFWAPSPTGAWNLDAFILSGAADMIEVLKWVESQRDGRKVEVFVEVDSEPSASADVQRGSALVRILGEDPDRGVTAELGTFVPHQS